MDGSRHPVKYFDLITQNTFDICSHLNFVETFKGAIIGPTEEAILVQYRKGTGCPDPGFRFLLRTRPGVVYRVSAEGFLHKGEKAVFFIESLKPRLRIVPKENSFMNQVKQKFSLNFRAVSNLTTIGILFKCEKINYCLALTELKVCKFDECLLPLSGGCDSRDGVGCSPGQCYDAPCSYPPRRPACYIGGPPTVNQLCPKGPKLDCLDEKPKKNCKKIDFCGRVVADVNSADCSELGKLALETSTCQLWICDGTQYIPFQSQQEKFLFQDAKCREVWKVKGDKCKKISDY